jgi:hypothetical protein
MGIIGEKRPASDDAAGIATKIKQAPAAVAEAVLGPKTETSKYVIVGGGVAAGYAAKTFVEGGLGKGQLLILSADDVRPHVMIHIATSISHKPSKCPWI